MFISFFCFSHLRAIDNNDNNYNNDVNKIELIYSQTLPSAQLKIKV